MDIAFAISKTSTKAFAHSKLIFKRRYVCYFKDTQLQLTVDMGLVNEKTPAFGRGLGWLWLQVVAEGVAYHLFFAKTGVHMRP